MALRAAKKPGPPENGGRGAATAPEAGRPAGPAWTAMLHLFALVVVVLAMSPATRNLDNIKFALYLGSGAAILCAAAVETALGRLRPPPLLFAAGMGAYFAVALVSTLLSAYRWAGHAELLFLWASIGFAAGGFAHGSRASSARVFLAGVTGLLLLVNLFGFFQFDLFGTGVTGVILLERALWGSNPEGLPATPLQTLFYTFSTGSVSSLMSTILNRDFYAAFCLLFLPFPLALALLSPKRGMKTFGFGTVGLSVLSVVLCQSKGEYIALVAGALLLGGLFALRGHRPRWREGYWTAWMLGAAMLMAAFVFAKLPFFGEQLKSIGDSVRSRLIIHQGAWRIFEAFPLLGGGPGTFKIYFPSFRSPDYFEWGISNVTQFSHNYVLDVLSETGMGGLIAVLLIFGPLVVRAIARVRHERDAWIAIPVICLLSGLSAFLISNLTSVSARWPIGAIGFWSVTGFLAGLVQRGEGQELEGRGAAPGGDGLAEGPLRAVQLRYVAWGLAVIAAILTVHSTVYARKYWVSQRVFADGFLMAEQYRDFAIRRIYAGGELLPEEERALVEKLETAAASLREAARIEPRFSSALYHLGSTESLLAGLDTAGADRHLEASLVAYEELQRLEPDYAELPYNLGIIHYQFVARLRDVLKRLPPGVEEERTRLEAAIEEHRKQALDHFQRMGQLSHRAEVLLNLGESYTGAERPDLALEVYRRGLALYPEDLRFPERVVRAGRSAGDMTALIEGQEALWALEPLRLDLMLGEGGALELSLELGDRGAAERLIARVKERMPTDPRVHGFEARLRDAAGEEARALQAVIDYLTLGGADGAIVSLGDALAGRTADGALREAYAGARRGAKSDGAGAATEGTDSGKEAGDR